MGGRLVLWAREVLIIVDVHALANGVMISFSRMLYNS